ncbi:head maturation protease, ClpP-related [Herbidospora daliensis]|uniref:head maturation protease, ClpP-related n=1 Tax=Herbidospora daliensis TaxID=295585 RepID=UPI0007847998|nr:head maturation protease, ClpP-related [Herbidospora daliensis]
MRGRRQARRTARAAIRTAPTPVEQPQTWFRIENLVAPDTTAIYIFDEIGYWGVTAADFARELASIAAPNIDLHINSPGGDVFEGLAIYNTIRKHPANVTVYIDGIAASAASFIAQAGDRVLISPNAVIMIHDASGMCIGNAEDMAEMVELLNGASDNIADIYARRAGGTAEEWRALMRAETWYHNGPDAVASGLADGLDEDDDEAEEEPEERVRRSAAARYAPAARAELAGLVLNTTAPAEPEAPEAPAVLPGPAVEEVAAEVEEGAEAATEPPAVEEPVEEPPVEVEETPAEPQEPEGVEPSAEAAAPDAWATATAGLLADHDDWAALTAGLLTDAPTWADLTEALL